MSLIAFLSATLALLLAPGPTNTLMGVAGAQGGMRHVLHLLPAELLGYLATILPLLLLGAGVLAQYPQLVSALTLASAIWVMVLALRLWGQQVRGGADTAITLRRVFVTTLLNPKALIFGLVLLPDPASPDILSRLGLFCLMVSGVAMVWGGAGVLAQAGLGGAARVQVIQRCAALWLAIVSITLIAGVIRA
ncbi:hypothetical protein [Gemmobacter serpentinus]|uniref:hypothetical protein n=1 Tax=Gemmobacter serpentinus TaxID=2652247 RepID=UPI00124DF694|nr:hypothetical protein [Gemmobacter serpentinus]